MAGAGALEAMADQGAREAMADQGAWVAMADQEAQEAMVGPRLYGWSPTTPKKFFLFFN